MIYLANTVIKNSLRDQLTWSLLFLLFLFLLLLLILPFSCSPSCLSHSSVSAHFDLSCLFYYSNLILRMVTRTQTPTYTPHILQHAYSNSRGSAWAWNDEFYHDDSKVIVMIIIIVLLLSQFFIYCTSSSSSVVSALSFSFLTINKYLKH